jgi:type 1 glutamine amidotransferase/nicotinamidase-related amidase
MMPTRIFVCCLTLLCTALIAQAKPLHVCLVSGSEEYQSDISLSAYKEYVEKRYDIQCTLLQANGFEDFPGLEALQDCDVALFFTRRLRIDGQQLHYVIDYIESGKPLVALRTASHGFQNWLECDAKVFGGNYNGHFGNQWTQDVKPVSPNETHPILDGVEAFRSPYSLYKTAPLASDTHILLESSIPNQEKQPAAWTRTYKNARIFYTSLGGLRDFENASFLRMITNALFWTARQEVRAIPAPALEPLQRKSTMITLPLRSRTQPFKNKQQWQEVAFEADFKTDETAIIICDMWDRHWCDGATERCTVLAQKMNPVIQQCRDAGMLIVHAPSDTLGYYTDTPARLRAQGAPAANPPAPLEIHAPALPIDDSDGGCDTDNTPYGAWSSQSPFIEISNNDFVSDQGNEIFNIFKQYGIQNVFIMGVHTNMCILNRSFAIKQMTKWGFSCILVRDLTDAMYDPGDRPFVTHDRGTGLVIEHIEQYWCPTTTSTELVHSLVKN